MRLTKHHGLGNDFLVLLDPDGHRQVEPDAVVELCSRRTGIGADGFIRAVRGTARADVQMDVFNADGSRAEMSGNGIRCLAQAVLRAGMVQPPTVRVRTDAGLRTVRHVERIDGQSDHLAVGMGPAKVGDDEPEWLDEGILRAGRVDLGNPHLVLHAVPGAPDVAEIGPRINELVPGGINVELLRIGDEPGVLEMTVYERGVGVTQACGTGACAVAAAANAWELAPGQVTVRMPGGDVEVEVGVGESVTLTGPATWVGVVEIPWR